MILFVSAAFTTATEQMKKDLSWPVSKLETFTMMIGCFSSLSDPSITLMRAFDIFYG